ncbi:MAG: glycosyltransferase family 9 protein [Candidatus Omnitrophica bacterium]|nr:glycosyltransferase family 9 protein [Candidatus Omnitrophota bacterium]
MLSGNIKRVLIVNPFGLGDCLFLSPVFRALKKSGVEKIVLLLGSRTSELFRNHPFVDEVIAIDRDQIRSQSRWENFLFVKELVVRLRREKFDAFLDVSLSREYAFFAKFFLGIRKRVGFDYHKRGIFLTDRIKLPEGYASKHAIQYYRDLLRPLGIEAETRAPEIFLGEDEIRSAQQFLSEAGISNGESFTVIVPGGGESWGKDARFKRWPATYFSDLVNQLKNDLPSRNIVILGSRGEKQLGDTLANALSNFNVINWMGERTLRESLAVLSQASLVLTNDGGLCHAAQVFNRPLVAIFGPVDPVVYGPYPETDKSIVVRRTDLACQPCYKSFRYNSSCQTIECLNDLSPRDVAAAIQERKFFTCLKH